MTRYPALDRNLPSLAPYLAWWLDGLSFERRDRGPGRAPVLEADALTRPPRRAAALKVAQRDWLTLRLKLPPVSRQVQKEIVGLEIADRTPFDPAVLHIDWRATGQTHIVRKAAVQAALKTAQANGGRIRWLINESDPTAWIDLTPVDQKPLRAAAVVTGCCVAALVVLSAFAVHDVGQLDRLRGQTERHLAKAEAAAAEARRLAREIDGLRSAQAKGVPAALLPERLPAHVLLERLSAATPDHSFLTSLEIAEEGAVLTGWSEAPEALMRALEADASFQNLRFRGPVVSGDDGYRFEIGLDWEPPA